jgi:hypothetical protein
MANILSFILATAIIDLPVVFLFIDLIVKKVVIFLSSQVIGLARL